VNVEIGIVNGSFARKESKNGRQSKHLHSHVALGGLPDANDRENGKERGFGCLALGRQLSPSLLLIRPWELPALRTTSVEHRTKVSQPLKVLELLRCI
jgi:hypothetical protein